MKKVKSIDALKGFKVENLEKINGGVDSKYCTRRGMCWSVSSIICEPCLRQDAGSNGTA